MGAVEGVFAIQFRPITAVLARQVASAVSMGAVVYPATSQDREPGSWADCGGKLIERAGLTVNGPIYVSRDTGLAMTALSGPTWSA